MAQHKKDSKPRTFRIQQDILDKLYKYSEDTGIPMTTVINKAILMYLNAHDSTGRIG